MEASIQKDFSEKLLAHLRTNPDAFARGYQGRVYLYRFEDRQFIIKSASGWGLGRLVRKLMLRNEHRVYQKLSETPGLPHCYGLVDGRYLVLEFVDGVPLRQARLNDRDDFFKKLYSIIESIHAAGVAHGDLKRKDNILVARDQNPYLVDFGVAITRKHGVAPLNHYLFRIARSFDLNAWVKLKYGRKYRNVSEADKKLLKKTVIEKLAHLIKHYYRKL